MELRAKELHGYHVVEKYENDDIRVYLNKILQDGSFTQVLEKVRSMILKQS